MTIRPKSVAVIGYGSQGRAQARRLSEWGAAVTVGLRPRSKARRLAKRDGFAVTTPQRAVRSADTVAMLVPDQVANPLLADLAGSLQPGVLLVFAAGFPLTFPRRPEPEDCDMVLVAPHGPGSDLMAGCAVSGFVGVHRDRSGRAWKRAYAYARAIGLDPVYETSPDDETMGDLFGEQALLCGGLLTLTAAVAEVMIQRGLSKENAYFETVAQLDRLAALLKDRGVDGFWSEISDCAAAGARDAAGRIVDARVRKNLAGLYREIESGAFARRFYRSGRPSRLPGSWRVLREMEAAVRKK